MAAHQTPLSCSIASDAAREGYQQHRARRDGSTAPFGSSDAAKFIQNTSVSGGFTHSEGASLGWVSDVVVVERSRVVVNADKGEVSLLLARPPDARAMLVLGHGAGSALSHPLVEALSEALNASGVATLRFNYPYSERGRGMDSEPVRLATVRAATAKAAEMKGELPLFAGGHSMSGRMTS